MLMDEDEMTIEGDETMPNGYKLMISKDETIMATVSITKGGRS